MEKKMSKGSHHKQEHAVAARCGMGCKGRSVRRYIKRSVKNKTLKADKEN